MSRKPLSLPVRAVQFRYTRERISRVAASRRRVQFGKGLETGFSELLMVGKKADERTVKVSMVMMSFVPTQIRKTIRKTLQVDGLSQWRVQFGKGLETGFSEL